MRSRTRMRSRYILNKKNVFECFCSTSTCLVFFLLPSFPSFRVLATKQQKGRQFLELVDARGTAVSAFEELVWRFRSGYTPLARFFRSISCLPSCVLLVSCFFCSCVFLFCSKQAHVSAFVMLAALCKMATGILRTLSDGELVARDLGNKVCVCVLCTFALGSI